MDVKILKAILGSCEDAVKSIENLDDYKNLSNSDVFLPTSDAIFDALALSLTNILCYKVSKEAYQRYSVRICVIDALRDLCRIKDIFQPVHAFTKEENTLKLIENLLKKYLVSETLDYYTNEDTLITLASALMCLSSKNVVFLPYFKKLIVRLSQLSPTERSEWFLCQIVNKKIYLDYTTSEITQIYSSYKYKLIEELLLDNFISTCPNLNKENCIINSQHAHLVDELIEFAARSAPIFQLVFSFLKELFIYLDHSPAILKYMQTILKRIATCCENQSKDILDLYPRHLHPWIPLLRIEPPYHTSNTIDYVLQGMHSLLSENRGSVVILMLHFPTWLEVLAKYLTMHMEDI